jgi:hypothetical protein
VSVIGKVTRAAKPLLMAFSSIAPLWPIFTLAPLGSRRRAILPLMLIAWTFSALMRGVQMVTGLPSGFTLIPQPLEPIAFWATGTLLIGLLLSGSIRQQRTLLHKAGGLHTEADLLNLTAPEFEQLVVELFRKRRQEARRTGRTGAHGADVIVRADDGEKWVVQCKRGRGNVGESTVRDFCNTVHTEKADWGILITTGDFSHAAKTWARTRPLTLITGKEFVRYWHLAQNAPAPTTNNQLAPQQAA